MYLPDRVQGSNAQLAVSTDQIIIATSLTQSTSDLGCLIPMVGGAGAAGFDPDMLLALLVYAYC
jgi:hypothetical protein